MIFAAGAAVIIKFDHHSPQDALLETCLFRTQILSQNTEVTTVEFFPADWDDLGLKNQCRKVIRKHLLTLDPHTKIFMRIPQLQMTPHRAGIPEYLVSYLLYEQSLEVDLTKIHPFHCH